MLSPPTNNNADGRGRWTTTTTTYWSAAPEPTATVTKSSCALIDDYTRHSTVHGMRYMNNAGLLDK